MGRDALSQILSGLSLKSGLIGTSDLMQNVRKLMTKGSRHFRLA